MIEIVYPSLVKKKHIPHLSYKPPSLAIYSPFEIEQAQRKNISPEEWRRRNNIIVEEANSFRGQVSDIVYPVDKGDYQKYGGFIVLGICRSYKDLPDDDWPTNDVPMVLHIRTIKEPKQTLNATVNWVITKNIHA